MTYGEWTIAVVAALGGGSGLAEVIRRARGPQRATSAAASKLPPPPSVPIVFVTHADLSALRHEMSTRIDAADADCEQRTADLSRRHDEHYHELAGEVRDVGRGVERALGILEGQSGARSRR